jgi:cytochrome c
MGLAGVAAMLLLGTGRARAADVAYGEYLAGECFSCHRKDGSEKGIPAIIGWPQDQLVAVFWSYKEKVRDNVTMQTIAARFTKEDMQAMAAYLETLKGSQR